jgi:cell fate regulator YaaT (PSP1 superfamily)
LYKVVGVRFKKAGKIYYFDPVDIPLATGDPVIVETARGIEFGNVTVGPKEVDDSEVTQPLKKVLRRATPEDLQTAEENCQREKRAFEIGLEKIANHNLEMKLVDVEYTFDRSKIIFYFTADGRVDFRELVKDLASVFRTRIELRQIGVRDEAKMLGGLGPCGRSLCISLNPAKISGICGRLMCCLKYESDCYKQGSGCCKGCGKQLENLPEAEEYIDEDQDFIDPELPED